MSLDFSNPEKEKAYELANRIKCVVDELVNKYGFKAIRPLSDIKGMKDWETLKDQSPFTILLAMRMYLDGVITTLHREKDC